MPAPAPQVAITGHLVQLVPVLPAHLGELRRIRETPEVAARWGLAPEPDGWPLDDPETSVFTILAAGELCGLIQFGEEDEPPYRHASIDISLTRRGRDGMRPGRRLRTGPPPHC